MSGTWTPSGGPTAGNDSFTAASTGSIADGLGGNDTLVGGAGSDILSGSDGDDSIIGGISADLLSGGAGADVISGGSGNDTIEGGPGADLLFGGTNSDLVSYASDTSGVTVDLDGNGNFTVSGGDAAGDTLNSFEHVMGGGGADVLTGTTGANSIFGEGGNDTLRGDDGADTLLGGAGQDSILGEVGADWLDGGDDGDTLLGGAGADTLLGGAGQDSLLGEAASDLLDGGDGNDTLNGGASPDTLLGGDGADLLDGGGSEADLLDFGAGNDSFTYVDGMGPDTLDGGSGADRLVLPNLSAWTVGSGADGFTTYTLAGTTLQVRNWEQVVCFAQGTRIMTARGEVPVERLRAGALVLAADGTPSFRPIRWVGHRMVDVGLHRQPERVAPVLVKAGALGAGVPARDLRVSPDHALFLDGHLVPARLLVNGASILQQNWCRSITYWHVELEVHGLLIAEGAPVESYREDGNRHLFDNAAVAAPFLDLATGSRAPACAPMLEEGPGLARIRARIAGRVSALPPAARSGPAAA